MEEQSKKILEFLKDTSYEKPTPSSIILKKSDLTTKQFNYYLSKLNGNAFIGHIARQAGWNYQTDGDPIENDQSSYFITDSGLSALKTNYHRIITTISGIVAATASVTLLLIIIITPLF